MANFIIVGTLIIIIGAAIVYIVKSKKSGKKCIGCPSGCSCSSNKKEHSECSCGCNSDTDK